MTAKVILNPYSNRWNAKARWPEAEAALKKAGVNFDLVVSEYKGHIVDLAKEAVRQQFSPIIVAGGDGSIGDAVNGMARGAEDLDAPIGPLGIMPVGSANDLISSLGIPLGLEEAAQVIAVGKTKLIDLGKTNRRYFANNSAIGLEPYVTTKQEKISWIKGIPRYLVAAIQAIMDKPQWNAKIEWDGGSYEGPLSLSSVGNGPRTGGIFYMTPHADLADGKLTLVYGYRPTRISMFQALPRAMKAGAGNYVELEGIYEIHCTRATIHLDKPSPTHTDGELLPKWIQDFRYEIFPQKLNIIVP